MPQIVLVGDWGIKSLGDDAMLQVLVKGILNRIEDAQIVPFSWLAMEPRRDDTVEISAARVKQFVESNTQLLARAGGESGGTRRVVKHGLWDVFEQADLVVLGGGNLLTDLNPSFFTSPMQRYTYLVGVTQALGVPLFACGVSIGPFWTSWAPKLARRILGSCEAITVRDAPSLEVVRGLGLDAELLPDLALALEPARRQGAKKVERELFIAVSPRITTDGSLGWMEPVAEALYEINRQIGLIPLLIPHCRFARYTHDDDTHVCLMLREMLGGEIPIVDASIADDPPAALAVYGRCAGALAMRMHGAVFAAMTGVPFVALDYWPKMHGFCEQVGVEALPMDATATEIVAAFGEVWEQRVSESVRLRERVAAMREQIPQYFDIIAELAGG